LDNAGNATVVDVVKTEQGARTAALDADSGKLYLPAAQPVQGSESESALVPSTFKVLVVAPK
jgi:hypothetical protein